MKKELIAKIAAQLKSYGYTVYISKTGEYGFYTDGKRVVSFGSSWDFCVGYSGNYKSRHAGCGWQIEGGDGLGAIDKSTAKLFIEANAPRWATKGETVTYTTPEQHLKMFGASSGYKEV